MPLKITRRKSTGALTISGIVAGTRIRRRAQSDDPKLAAEEAAALEAELLRTAWHGERRGSRTFAEAVTSYLEAAPRTESTKARVRRLLLALGTARLGEIDQGTVGHLKKTVLRPNASLSTIERGIIVPLRAILRHAHRRGWCDAPMFEIPRRSEGRTRYLLPAEAERLLTAAAPHVRPLLVFLISSGARMSEAIELDWRDLDLQGNRAIFWRTKTGKRRIVVLPPRAVADLATLPHREGSVFRWETTPSPKGAKPSRIHTYADRGREEGGHIKRAWQGAIRRARLDPELTPHDCRHTWASWHYALHKDLLRLKAEGGWSSVTLVERYAHLLPAGQEAAIRHFLGWHHGDTAAGASPARP
jgi:integrase